MPIPYVTGLHRIATDTYTYLQGNLATGYSNAGLVLSGDEALLVDTLYTVGQTRQMLSAIEEALPAADIRFVANTHNDGDHWWGNQLVADATIISSTAAAREMRRHGPETVAAFISADADPRLRAILAPFDYSGITPTYPTITFDGTLELTVGTRTVQLIEVGPAHSVGDVLVYVPDERVLYAGDIMVFGGHGVVHCGPVTNYLAACDVILGLDIDVVVPGHGPVGGKAEVARFRTYLERVQDHAINTHRQGKTALESATEFDLSEFADLDGAARIVLNIGAVYRDLNGDGTPAGRELFMQMIDLKDSMESQVAI